MKLNFVNSTYCPATSAFCKNFKLKKVTATSIGLHIHTKKKYCVLCKCNYSTLGGPRNCVLLLLFVTQQLLFF